MSDDTTKLLKACVEYRAMVDKLETENAALRAALVNADEIERYNGAKGERQWGRCSAWLHPDDAVVIISAKTLDEVRKMSKP